MFGLHQDELQLSFHTSQPNRPIWATRLLCRPNRAVWMFLYEQPQNVLFWVAPSPVLGTFLAVSTQFCFWCLLSVCAVHKSLLCVWQKRIYSCISCVFVQMTVEESKKRGNHGTALKRRMFTQELRSFLVQSLSVSLPRWWRAVQVFLWCCGDFPMRAFYAETAWSDQEGLMRTFSYQHYISLKMVLTLNKTFYRSILFFLKDSSFFFLIFCIKKVLHLQKWFPWDSALTVILSAHICGSIFFYFTDLKRVFFPMKLWVLCQPKPSFSRSLSLRGHLCLFGPVDSGLHLLQFLLS